jgi:hypothetical protein
LSSFDCWPNRYATVNLAIMGSIRDGTVYLCLDVDICDEEDTGARWNGHCEYRDGSHPEFGPDFLDANDAVTWWRERGATRIYIRLDLEETLWAGEGSSPADSAKIAAFDFSDPRGRPEGARKTLEGLRRALAEREASEHGAGALEEGRRLTQRREFVDLSIDELANRVGESSEWLADVEAGKTTSEVIFSQWLNLVWATRKGWPDEMRSTKSEVSGWVARQGQFLREAEISVNQMLGLYD